MIRFYVDLPDGNVLYEEEQALDYLLSLGFTEDILYLILNGGTKEDIDWYKEQYDAMELALDGCYLNNHYCVQEIEELCEQLASGKGGTKIQYADRILECVKNYLTI